MKIDLKKFLGLTGLMAAPLMTAPLSGCVIVSDDGEESATASDTANNTSGATEGGTSAGTDGGTSAGTDGGTTGTGSAGSTGAATDAETSPTGTDSGTAGTGADTEGTTPLCCEATFELGCAEDPAIEKCVCAQDALCCDEGWDDICVSEIEQFDCGEPCPVIDPTGE